MSSGLEVGAHTNFIQDLHLANASAKIISCNYLILIGSTILRLQFNNILDHSTAEISSV